MNANRLRSFWTGPGWVDEKIAVLSSDDLLHQICELAVRRNFRPDRTPLEWMSQLIRMHERGWLYCSMKGSRLMAVAGAYRIGEWDLELADRLPESAGGDILYIPFLFSTEEVSVACLRVLRYVFKQHAGVHTVIYNRGSLHVRSLKSVRETVFDPAGVSSLLSEFSL